MPRRNTSTPITASRLWQKAMAANSPVGPNPAGPDSVQASGSWTTQKTKKLIQVGVVVLPESLNAWTVTSPKAQKT